MNKQTQWIRRMGAAALIALGLSGCHLERENGPVTSSMPVSSSSISLPVEEEIVMEAAKEILLCYPQDLSEFTYVEEDPQDLVNRVLKYYDYLGYLEGQWVDEFTLRGETLDEVNRQVASFLGVKPLSHYVLQVMEQRSLLPEVETKEEEYSEKLYTSILKNLLPSIEVKDVKEYNQKISDYIDRDFIHRLDEISKMDRNFYALIVEDGLTVIEKEWNNGTMTMRQAISAAVSLDKLSLPGETLTEKVLSMMDRYQEAKEVDLKAEKDLFFQWRSGSKEDAVLLHYSFVPVEQEETILSHIMEVKEEFALDEYPLFSSRIASLGVSMPMGPLCYLPQTNQLVVSETEAGWTKAVKQAFTVTVEDAKQEELHLLIEGFTGTDQQAVQVMTWIEKELGQKEVTKILCSEGYRGLVMRLEQEKGWDHFAEWLLEWHTAEEKEQKALLKELQEEVAPTKKEPISTPSSGSSDSSDSSSDDYDPRPDPEPTVPDHNTSDDQGQSNEQDGSGSGWQGSDDSGSDSGHTSDDQGQSNEQEGSGSGWSGSDSDSTTETAETTDATQMAAILDDAMFYYFEERPVTLEVEKAKVLIKC